MKNTLWKNQVFLLLVLCFFSCRHSPPQQIFQTKPTVYTFRGNKIVFLDAYYTDYLRAVRTNYKEKDKFYKERIEEPILAYFAKCPYLDLVKENYSSPMHDTSGLQVNIASIIRNEPKIEEIFSSELLDCNKYLRNDSITIYVQPAINFESKILQQRSGGNSGLTAGGRQILLMMDISDPGWDNAHKYILAHEFEHAYWTNAHQYDTNSDMLNYLIFEGRADSYAYFLYPNIVVPWASNLSDSAKAGLWNRIKPQLYSHDMKFEEEVMFGSDKYPACGGYILGFNIVQSALKNNPQLTPVQWANLKPEEILEMSDYGNKGPIN